MRKLIRFPAPELSQLKEAEVELEMTGRHYALLASSEGMVPEEVALSIIKDLMKGDANKLTLNELRYLFMLVKIHSLENDYKVSVECPNKLENGKECKHISTFKVRLSDADLNKTPKGYKPPEVKMTSLDDVDRVYKVMPPTMDMECLLYSWFLNHEGKGVEDLAADKGLMYRFTYLRNLMHLVDSETGKRMIEGPNELEAADSLYDKNKYSTIRNLYSAVLDVSKYGVQNKLYEVKCKECGGSMSFRLPLLDGLFD